MWVFFSNCFYLPRCCCCCFWVPHTNTVVRSIALNHKIRRRIIQLKILFHFCSLLSIWLLFVSFCRQTMVENMHVFPFNWVFIALWLPVHWYGTQFSPTCRWKMNVYTNAYTMKWHIWYLRFGQWLFVVSSIHLF